MSHQDSYRSEKTSGHATTSGQDYEVALCCLVFLRALRLASDFFLLSNCALAEKLDDVVLFYKLRGDPMYRAILLQAKYREKPKQKKLTKSNPFSLTKYLDSFTSFKAKCVRGVPLEGELIEVMEVSVVLYSSDGCDFAGIARDVTAEPNVQLLRDFLNTGGQLLRITNAQWLGLPEDFVSCLTLCTEQMSLNEADGYLERELGTVLGLPSSTVPRDLKSRLREGVKRWWESRGPCHSLTAQSQVWKDVLELQVAHLNGPQLNLTFSEEALAEVRFALSHELTWITVADEHQARAMRSRLLQAVGSSCLVLNAGFLADSQVALLWGTAVCPTLAVDLSADSPPDWSELLKDFRGHAGRRLAIVAVHGTPSPDAQWFLLQAEATWSVLNQATRDRLLAAKVNLQGHVVALRDIVGGDAPPRMSDKVISALCDPAAGVLQLGKAADSSSLEYYVHQCLQRTAPGKINFANLHHRKTLVFSFEGLSNFLIIKYRLTILALQELERMNEIAQAKLVRGVHSHSKIRKECCRLGVQGVSEDEWERKVTEFIPLTWLCEDRVVIVEGVAGVGKSTFVTMMCSKVKQRFPASWVLRFDLAKHTDFIKRGRFSDIPGFLLRVLPDERQSLLHDVLEHSLYVVGNVFLFMDAFDEISPDYTAQCCLLLKEIASKLKFHQMVITTRTINTKEVEEALGTKAFSLPVFSEEEQDLFLERFGKSKDKLVDQSTISSLHQAAGPVLEVPLLCRMAAEVLLFSEDQNVLRYKNPWRKVLLYKRFVEQTTVNRPAEKLDLPLTLLGKGLLESQSNEHLRNLQAMAIRKLMPEVQLPNVELSTTLPNEKLGLVVSDGASIDFEHQTFAEYFLGCWLAQHWEQCPEKLLRELLAREDTEFVGATLSWSLFEDVPLHLAVARGEQIQLLSPETTDKGGRSALHVAAMTPGGLLPVVVGEDLNRRDKVLRVTAARCAEMFRNWEFLEVLIEKGMTLEDLRCLTDQDTAEKVFDEALRRDLPGLLSMILYWHPGIHELRFTLTQNTLLHIAADYDSIKVIRYLLMEQPLDVDVKNTAGVTPLHLSVRCGCVKAVTLLLENGADPNKEDEDGLTALMLAALCGQQEVMGVLLRKGADSNKQNKHGFTALMMAAVQGHLEVMEVILEKGADTNIQDEHGSTTLMRAAERGHLEMVEVLLEKGAETNIQDEHGSMALMRVAERGYLEVVEVLLDKGAETNIQDEHGSTALMKAAERGYLEVVEVLLEKGADTNMQDEYGNVAFLLAARGGHLEVVELLLEKVADTNIKGKHGNTALMFAARRGHLEVVELLLDKGADTNILHEEGYTALMRAADKHHLEVVMVLLEKGADTNIQDEDGNTALMIAARRGHLKVVEVLLEKAADTNIQNEHGITAFMLAAYEGHLEVVELLLGKGADTNIQDERGSTALMAAAYEGHLEVVELLLDKGADTNIQDEDGNKALMLAAEEGHLEVVEVLRKIP